MLLFYDMLLELNTGRFFELVTSVMITLHNLTFIEHKHTFWASLGSFAMQIAMFTWEVTRTADADERYFILVFIQTSHLSVE